jgi:hypothetical protein
MRKMKLMDRLSMPSIKKKQKPYELIVMGHKNQTLLEMPTENIESKLAYIRCSHLPINYLEDEIHSRLLRPQQFICELIRVNFKNFCPKKQT